MIPRKQSIRKRKTEIAVGRLYYSVPSVSVFFRRPVIIIVNIIQTGIHFDEMNETRNRRLLLRSLSVHDSSSSANHALHSVGIWTRIFYRTLTKFSYINDVTTPVSIIRRSRYDSVVSVVTFDHEHFNKFSIVFSNGILLNESNILALIEPIAKTHDRGSRVCFPITRKTYTTRVVKRTICSPKYL